MKIKLKVRKIFFSIIRHERYLLYLLFIFLFSAGYSFSPVISLQVYFPSKSVCRIVFFGWKSPTTPQKWNGRPLKSTKRLLSRQILICQSLLKPLATVGDKTLQESGRIRFYLPLPEESVRWRQKQIFWDGWPIFLRYGSTRARRLRYEREVPVNGMYCTSVVGI